MTFEYGILYGIKKLLLLLKIIIARVLFGKFLPVRDAYLNATETLKGKMTWV